MIMYMYLSELILQVPLGLVRSVLFVRVLRLLIILEFVLIVLLVQAQWL